MEVDLSRVELVALAEGELESLVKQAIRVKRELVPLKDRFVDVTRSARNRRYEEIHSGALY